MAAVMARLLAAAALLVLSTLSALGAGGRLILVDWCVRRAVGFLAQAGDLR